MLNYYLKQMWKENIDAQMRMPNINLAQFVSFAGSKVT